MNTLMIAHRFIREHVKPGALCIDATAGRGNDTALLAELAGEEGKVIALDIQEAAVESTRALLAQKGLAADVHLESHSEMDKYAQEGTVDCITFNFGWLPGGDHNIHTQTESSIQAIKKGLKLLKVGGIMSLCIYYGRETGFEEKEAILEYLKTINDRKYTVIVLEFTNRPNCPPIPVCITRDSE